MADNWQAGDLALCVRRDNRWPVQVQPGGVFTVECVWDDVPHTDTGILGPCLDFVGVERWGDENAFRTSAFRKIRPHTPDAEDAETIRLLTGAPAKEPAA